jgi:hypothetical protein
MGALGESMESKGTVMDRRSICFVALASQLAWPAGCSGPEPAGSSPSRGTAPASSRSAAVTAPANAAAVPDGCFAKFVQQPPAAGSKVDIVFVTDTSGSMDDEQDAVAAALDRLITGIDVQGDYHIGVLPAHGSLGSSTGLLWKGWIDLCPSCSVTAPADAGDLLRQKFENLRSDPAGGDPASDGGEMGMYSLYRMMTDRFDAAPNAGFVRSDAALAVIFLSDENDICAYPPLSGPGQTMPPDFKKWDPQGAEADEYARTCAAISPDGGNVLAALLTRKADRPAFVGGILYNNLGNGLPPYDVLIDPYREDELGHGYLDMIGLAGGFSVDLALPSIDVTAFNNEIQQLGTAVASQPIRVVQLDHAPLVAATIHQYNLPGTAPVAPDPSDYNPVTNQVTLHDPGAPGGIVQINYCPVVQPCNDLDDFCLEDDGPTPCPALDQFVVPMETGGALLTWRGDTSCTACSLRIQRRDEGGTAWTEIGGSPFQVLRNTTFSHRFGIAPRFGKSHYRFTYQRFHSGDDGPPKLDVCHFTVSMP